VTPTDRFTLLMTGIGLMFTIMSAVLALLWRAGNTWGELTATVKHLAEAFGQFAVDTNRRLEHIESHAQIKRRR
jgi:hypothetical protein